MKKQRFLFFALFLGCFAPVLAYAAPNITVSASAVTILGTTQSISITVTLIDPNNTGMLRISGTGIVPVTVTSTVTPGTTATVGPIYGNDVIIDGFGNLNGTYYKVQVFTVTGGIIASTPSLQNFYAFTGSGTIDLSTATPLAPSFMTGTGGSVSMPGNLSVTGTSTFTGAITAGSDTMSGTLTVGKINNIFLIDGTKYPITQVGIQQAITDACAQGNGTGAEIILPAGQTVTLSNTTGNQFNITCTIHIHGSVQNSFWFVLASGIPSTVPVFNIAPAANNGGFEFDHFRIVGSVANTGGDIFFFDTTNGTVNWINIHQVIMNANDAQSTGNWFVNIGTGGANQNFFGHMWDNIIVGGIQLNSTNVEDSWLFEHNSFVNNVGNTTPCFNVTTASGAAQVEVRNNNGSCGGGFFISHGTLQPKITHNQIEQLQATSEVNGCIIDLMGDVGTIDGAEIDGNNINEHTNATCGIRLDHVTNTTIKGRNVITLKPVTGVGIVLTANAASVLIDPATEFSGVGGGAVAMTNASSVHPFQWQIFTDTGTSPFTGQNDGSGGGKFNDGTNIYTMSSGRIGEPFATNPNANVANSVTGLAALTSQKAETGSADASVLTYAAAAVAGTYRVCFTASVSSATSGVIGWTLSWTDSNGNAQSNIAQSLIQQGTAAPALTFTTSAASNYQSCSQIDVNNAGANVIVKWVGGGTTAAKVSAAIERII